PSRRRTMGEAGRKRVAEQFTRSVMAERHIGLYTRVRAARG
ncbi:MAG: glycosyl transferase family 1, partial [Gemmatimonadales bacterium]|nr:glycosyl transferase family 1 [Gemmatimonadales bacterium]